MGRAGPGTDQGLQASRHPGRSGSRSESARPFKAITPIHTPMRPLAESRGQCAGHTPMRPPARGRGQGLAGSANRTGNGRPCGHARARAATYPLASRSQPARRPRRAQAVAPAGAKSCWTALSPRSHPPCPTRPHFWPPALVTRTGPGRRAGCRRGGSHPGLAEAPRRPRREAPETAEARRGARPHLNRRGVNHENHC